MISTRILGPKSRRLPTILKTLIVHLHSIFKSYGAKSFGTKFTVMGSISSLHGGVLLCKNLGIRKCAAENGSLFYPLGLMIGLFFFFFFHKSG